VLAGDYNVIPTDLDADKPERWVDDALFFPESHAAYAKLLAQVWTDAVRTLHPDEKIPSGTTSGTPSAETRASASTISC
jgi:exodeoxyribonuclease-3